MAVTRYCALYYCTELRCCLKAETQCHYGNQQLCNESYLLYFQDEKAEKIREALAKMRAASVTRLYVKAFSPDGSSKALMVDEGMSCGRVLALLADKNHVPMSTRWALVEYLPHLHMGKWSECTSGLDKFKNYDGSEFNRVATWCCFGYATPSTSVNKIK